MVAQVVVTEVAKQIVLETAKEVLMLLDTDATAAKGCVWAAALGDVVELVLEVAQ